MTTKLIKKRKQVASCQSIQFNSIENRTKYSSIFCFVANKVAKYLFNVLPEGFQNWIS